MRWREHVAQMGKMRNAYRILVRTEWANWGTKALLEG
jgi:hypothetical protein